MTERLPPEQAVRLLRAKAAELENRFGVLSEHRGGGIDEDVAYLTADIALIAGLLADHIEQSPGPWGPEDEGQGIVLTTVEVQHDASFNESPVSEWRAGDPPGPGEPGDASDAT